MGITNTSLPATLNESIGTELDAATNNVDTILNNKAFINEEGKLKDTNEISKLINDTYGRYNINSGGVISFAGNLIKIINAQKEGDITTNEKFIQLSDVLNDPVISNFEQVRSFIKANISQPKAVTQAVQAAEEPLSYPVREMFLEGEFIENNNRYLYLMNVYFNMNWILSKIDSTIDSEGNIILLDFLQSLCDGFSEATCYYNKLTPTINENTEIIFIDEIGLPDRDAFLVKPDFKDKAVQTVGDGKELAKFNMFGYKESGGQASFIRDFSMKTEIPASFATMITVGAQARGLVVGEDATCLSKMNYGLTDRMKPEIIDANIDSTVSEAQQLINNFYDSVIPITPTVIEFLKTVYENRDLGNPDLIDSMKNIGKDLVKLNKTINSINQALATTEDKSKNPYKSSPGNGFIPFNLQLTMDGLSGFKIYQKYTAEQEFLPTNYAESLDFIIKGITQNIENNQWTTVIESLGMPKNPEGSGNVNALLPQNSTSTNTGAAKAPRAINSNLTAYDGGDWVTIAVKFISAKEGFLEKAKFDANAYRLGYGTDTVIDAKSRKTRKVVQGDTTTRADADAVLKSEIQTTYYNRLVGSGKNKITKDAFDKLNDKQKAALISYVYNVGSLRAAIKTNVQAGQYALATRLIAEGPITSNGTVIPGLVQRRREEAALFSS